MTELALGTVQLGMEYGVTNRMGPVSPSEATAILNAFARNGGRWLDTAPAYGTSEHLLGQNQNPFAIVDKTVHLDPHMSVTEGITALDKGLTQSLRCLNRTRLDTLLCHQAWLLQPPWREMVLDWLSNQQADGRVGRIGVSIYQPEELDDVLLSRLDWVQFPFNALDQRMLESGWLDRLHRAGLTTQARSLFLQGVLLAPEKAGIEIPRDVSEALTAFHRTAARLAVTPEALALALGCRKQVDQVVVGVNSLEEYRTLQESWQQACHLNTLDIDWSEFSQGSRDWLNPSNWKRLS